ncbi:MAG: SRPBCC family protein [Reyranellaceae bacterium]
MLALIVLFFAGGYLLSPKFTVVRSVVIQASADKVYALMADPRRWKEWSVWNRRDPAMAIEYSGPESGAGAVWSWKRKCESDGKMTFAAAEPGKRVAFDLFFPAFEVGLAGLKVLAER